MRSLASNTVQWLNLELSAEKRNWIIKDIIPSDFDYLLDMYRGLPSCPYLRPLHDTVPEQSLFVFKYCTGHLFTLTQKNLPIALTKRILRDTLRGLAVLHDHDIVHTGKSLQIAPTV